VKGKNGRIVAKTTETCAKHNEPEGLATVLRHSASKRTAPKGSDCLEQFLRRLDRTLLTLAMNSDHKNNCMDSTIKQTMKALSSLASVVIPTDKTNSYRLIPLEEFITCMGKQLEPVEDEISVRDLKRILNKAQETLKTVKN